MEGTVELKPAEGVDFSRLVSFEDIKTAAADNDMVHQLEGVLMMWYKQIEQVHIVVCRMLALIYFKHTSTQKPYIFYDCVVPCKTAFSVIPRSSQKVTR